MTNQHTTLRPLYTELAWAYDCLVPGPISQCCDFLQESFTQRGVGRDSAVLDAGCGTGSYAIGLAHRGYQVTGVDASAELLSVARQKAQRESVAVELQIANISKLAMNRSYDGLLCRGVLNDIIEDSERQGALSSFGSALRKDGVLIVDVRDWGPTALRYTQEPVFEKVVDTARGRLTFRSHRRLDRTRNELFVKEQHRLEEGTKELTFDYDFRMRCWTLDELSGSLRMAGFGSIEWLGAYDRTKLLGSTDRLVAVATLES